MVLSASLRSLNPRKRVGSIIASPLKVHGGRANGDTGTRVREILPRRA